jgi:crotonobetainyl-CoA:carnitine CoA-transferase CaiB-like acyl-CoA transferase
MSNILEGIKVVEQASFLAVPSVGAMLSDYGAEVIHVEGTGHGDPFRSLYKMPPCKPSETNYPWLLANRNKKSVALNLKDPDAQQVLYKLVADADIFLTNSLPHVISDLNVSYEKLSELNPKLIYAFFTGFGAEGEEADAPGFDETAWWARTGLMNVFRYPGADPILAPTGVGDLSSGIGLLATVMTALYHRERTGEGSKVCTSLMECGLWSNAIQVQGALVGCDSFQQYVHEETMNPLVGGIFTTKDDRQIFLVQLSPKNWGDMCAALGCSNLATDPRFNNPGLRINNAKELMGELDKVFGTLTKDEAVAKLHAAKTNFSLVQTAEEAPDDAQMNANNCFPEIENTNGLRTVRNFMTIEGKPHITPQPAPDRVGADTVHYMKAAGYSDDEIAKLAGSGAVGVPS